MDPDRLLVQIAELRERLTTLAQENAVLRAERDIALARAKSYMPWATPEQEAEMRKIVEGPQVAMEDVIAAVERITGSGNGVK